MSNYNTQISKSIFGFFVIFLILLFGAITSDGKFHQIIFYPLLFGFVIVAYSQFKNCDFCFDDKFLLITIKYLFLLKKEKILLYDQIEYAKVMRSTGSNTRSKVVFYLVSKKRVSCPISSLEDMQGFINNLKTKVLVVELNTFTDKIQDLRNRKKSDYPLKRRDY